MKKSSQCLSLKPISTLIPPLFRGSDSFGQYVNNRALTPVWVVNKMTFVNALLSPNCPIFHQLLPNLLMLVWKWVIIAKLNEASPGLTPQPVTPPSSSHSQHVNPVLNYLFFFLFVPPTQPLWVTPQNWGSYCRTTTMKDSLLRAALKKVIIFDVLIIGKLLIKVTPRIKCVRQEDPD